MHTPIECGECGLGEIFFARPCRLRSLLTPSAWTADHGILHLVHCTVLQFCGDRSAAPPHFCGKQTRHVQSCNSAATDPRPRLISAARSRRPVIKQTTRQMKKCWMHSAAARLTLRCLLSFSNVVFHTCACVSFWQAGLGAEQEWLLRWVLYFIFILFMAMHSAITFH